MKKILISLFLVLAYTSHAQQAVSLKQIDQIRLDFPVQEFIDRRQAAYDIYPDGIILIPSNSRPRSMEQHGFIQNTLFYYYTGLSNAIGAVLVIDGPRKKSLLFVPETLGYAPMDAAALVRLTEENRRLLAIDSLWSDRSLEKYIDSRLNEPGNVKLYSARQSDGIRFQNYSALPDPWTTQLPGRWRPYLKGEPFNLRKQQEIKSRLEIEAMRAAGRNGANAILKVIPQVKPGKSSREVEGVVVQECLCNGGNGVYFWPLIVQGEMAAYPQFFRLLFDYRNLQSTLEAGQLVRIDLGCDYNHYKSDVGRTVPVSGKFSASQREIYDLLAYGYLAGLKTFKDGIRKEDVLAAFRAEIQKHAGELKTEEGKNALDFLLSPTGTGSFEIHEMGLGGTEKEPAYLKEGMVVAWEPMFTINNDAYYLEDLVLITRTGYEVLTPGLPYFAADIEKLMKKNRK